MSTDLCLVPQIRFADLFDGRLERFGVREHVADATDETSRCLTDGNNCVWAYRNDQGYVACITRFAPGGNPNKILAAVEEAFGCTIYSEYQPQYWGFETFEDRDRAWQEAAALQPGSVAPLDAEIAMQLHGETFEERDPAWEEDAKFAMELNAENREE